MSKEFPDWPCKDDIEYFKQKCSHDDAMTALIRLIRMYDIPVDYSSSDIQNSLTNLVGEAYSARADQRRYWKLKTIMRDLVK